MDEFSDLIITQSVDDDIENVALDTFSDPASPMLTGSPLADYIADLVDDLDSIHVDFIVQELMANNFDILGSHGVTFSDPASPMLTDSQMADYIADLVDDLDSIHVDFIVQELMANNSDNLGSHGVDATPVSNKFADPASHSFSYNGIEGANLSNGCGQPMSREAESERNVVKRVRKNIVKSRVTSGNKHRRTNMEENCLPATLEHKTHNNNGKESMAYNNASVETPSHEPSAGTQRWFCGLLTPMSLEKHGTRTSFNPSANGNTTLNGKMVAAVGKEENHRTTSDHTCSSVGQMVDNGRDVKPQVKPALVGSTSQGQANGRLSLATTTTPTCRLEEIPEHEKSMKLSKTFLKGVNKLRRNESTVITTNITLFNKSNVVSSFKSSVVHIKPKTRSPKKRSVMDCDNDMTTDCGGPKRRHWTSMSSKGVMASRTTGTLESACKTGTGLREVNGASLSPEVQKRVLEIQAELAHIRERVRNSLYYGGDPLFVIEAIDLRGYINGCVVELQSPSLLGGRTTKSDLLIKCEQVAKNITRMLNESIRVSQERTLRPCM